MLHQLQVGAVDGDIGLQAIVEGRGLPAREVIVVGVILCRAADAVDVVGGGDRRDETGVDLVADLEVLHVYGVDALVGDEVFLPDVGAGRECIFQGAGLQFIDGGGAVGVVVVAPVAVVVGFADHLRAIGQGEPARAGGGIPAGATAATAGATCIPAIAVDVFARVVLHVAGDAEVLADRLDERSAEELRVSRAHVLFVTPIPGPGDVRMGHLKRCRFAGGCVVVEEVAEAVGFLAIAFFGEEFQLRALGGFPSEVDLGKLDFALGVLAVVLRLGVHTVEADADFSSGGFAGVVHVDRAAVFAVALAGEADGGEVLFEINILGDAVHHAAGIGEAVECGGRALDDFDAGEALRVDRVVLADAIAKAPVLHEAAEEKSVVGLLNEIVGVDVGAAVDEGRVIALQLDL